MIANSKEWWENEFINNWEVGIDGKEQTRYFMGLLISHLPQNILNCLACPNHTVLDWGCALGQGLDQLNQSFNNQLLEGYDFSEQAINKARELFPRYKFHNQIPSEKYDFVITSNCLEHFENPMKQLEEIAKLSRNCIIVMTPYNQIITNEVHPVTITEDTFPKSMNGFKKTQTIIVPNVKPELGGGEQILVVYEKIMDGEL